MSSTLTRERVRRELAERLGGADIEDGHLQLVVRVQPDGRTDALSALKELGFSHYIFCCAVDWPEENRFEVLDHVYNIDTRERVTVRFDIPRDEPVCPTATTVYAGADWHERETAELYGVVFRGHPKPTRLLLPDWFEGYPMRKDYDLPARVEKPWPGESFKPE